MNDVKRVSHTLSCRNDQNKGRNDEQNAAVRLALNT